MLKVVVNNKETLDITNKQFDYIRNISIATIFEHKVYIELIIKYIHVSYDIEQLWLEKAIEKCDIDLAEWLMRDIGVAL
jgi:hypothetical protein